MNQRTMETRYYEVSGAEEYSAMDSARGRVQKAGINAIIFQVRAEADALYKSPYEPWSRFFTGVLEISAAVRLRQEIKGEIWLAFSGLLSIFLGAIVLWIFFSRPVESFLAAGWLLSFYAAVYGVTLLFLSWRLRKTRQG